MRVGVWLLVWCLSVVTVAAQAPSPLTTRVDELRERIELRSYDDAEALAAAVREDAAQAGDDDTVALTMRLLGGMRVDQERLPEARAQLAAAQEFARAHGLRRRELEASLMLSRVGALDGTAGRAEADAVAALDGLIALDLPRESTLWAFNQALAAAPDMAVGEVLLTRARPYLRADDRFAVACSLWHASGDHAFNKAAYVEAHESLSTALACYEGLPRGGGDAGRVLVSLGRVQRAHGQLLAALDYYKRAARLQEANGDIPAMLQSLNAQAVTYDRLERHETAERLYRRALGIARERSLERYEVFLQGNLGGSLLYAGNTAAALRELQSVLEREKSPYLRATRLRQIADAWRELGQYDKALTAIDGAARVLPTPGFDDRVSWLATHALITARLGNLDAAQRDLEEAIGMIEDARARTLPGDVARRGFGDLHQWLFAVSIDVAMRRGGTADALELAEQARARALLDLMQDDGRAGRASPPKVAEMQALARRLDSTLLVYWVDRASTFAWVVSADRVHGHRLAISERALRRLVGLAAGSGNVPAAINAALLGGADLHAWRALHRAIVAPLSASLPARAGARLTIIPHGPLLHLPFAALLDTRGRFLIERYALHYAPSVAVLDAAARRPASNAAGRALVLGDPAPLPRVPGLQLPPPLPHARLEARRVARRFTRGALLSVGGAATERSLREAVADYGWLHVATHARVAEESTAQSYLLLARGQGGTADDGLLTEDEVRTLPLDGATVVLSACGTALGRVTGEGTIGFTRSFLAAGARAIVATTWEVPDQSGLQLTNAFYAARSRGAGVSDALRSAQLQQLRALRAGTVTMKAGDRNVVLPATPLLWAGYIAVGVP
jgi:CHAT domain-containing protein/tetratricopeptide (TPR) repeat protein